MAVPEFRWGIIGTGWIAGMFVDDLLASRNDGPIKHRVTIVGSSSDNAKAQEFIQRHWKDSKQPPTSGSYKQVYNHPDIDIVYIATPHALHKKNCLDAIQAGKNVLCEKPLTINSREAEEVMQAADERGVFLMEAVWTRFFPLVIELEKQLQAKVIGSVRRSIVEIGLALDWDALPKKSRIKNPELGGGALLDIGIYPLTYSSIIMGNGRLGVAHPKVETMSSMVIVDNIDESDVVTLRYTDSKGFEQTAICLSTVHFRNPKEFGRIEGTEGSIILYTNKGPSCPAGFRLTKHGETRDFKLNHPQGVVGFIYEADEVATDVLAGRRQNARMPLAETLRMMRLMDEIRDQCELVYIQDLI